MVDQVLQVNAGGAAITGQECLPQPALKALNHLGLVEVRRDGVQGLELAKGAHHFVAPGLELTQALGPDIPEIGLGLDAFVPALEPP